MIQFERTPCACAECVSYCKRKPGPLALGDFERIAAYLGEPLEQAKRYFEPSKGALLGDRSTGKTLRVPSITPRMADGRCVFLDDDDRCSIHAVAPAGCAFFDAHMDLPTAQHRSLAVIATQATAEYQALRSSLAP